jgi:hypothetical protein
MQYSNEPTAESLGAFAGIAADTTKRNVLSADKRLVIHDVFPRRASRSGAVWVAEFTAAVDASGVASNDGERYFARNAPTAGRAEKKRSEVSSHDELGSGNAQIYQASRSSSHSCRTDSNFLQLWSLRRTKTMERLHVALWCDLVRSTPS